MPVAYALVIEPDGSVTYVAEPFGLAEAKAAIGAEIDVCTAIDREHVIAVDEWGAVNGLPANFVAWCLYGRSMLFGSACVWRDDRGPLAEPFVTMVDQASTAWRSEMADVAADIARAYWRDALS